MGRRLEDKLMELSQRLLGLSRPSPKFAQELSRLKKVFVAFVEAQRRWENAQQLERRHSILPVPFPREDSATNHSDPPSRRSHH